MYLVDTNVISELRKKERANAGVWAFFTRANVNTEDIYLSVITIGELRRGVELIRYRGDHMQAEQLENWLTAILNEYKHHILPIGDDEAQIWGKLRAPHHENAIDKLLAATAFTYDLTLVTRNTKDFKFAGIKVLNPFT